MTEIYLIRHTQAEGNIARMMQGHWDGDITPLGEQQIAALAERFRDIKIDALYSSDLYRTRATASAITKYHAVPMNTDARLREIMLGSWESRYFGDVAYETPELADTFWHRAEEFIKPGAETYFDVQRRMCRAMFEIAGSNEGKTVAVVSHGAAIRTFMSFVTGIRLNDIGALPIFSNTAVTHLFFNDGGFSCDYMNDASHLDAASLPAWGRAPDLRGESVNPMLIRGLYSSAYHDTWVISKGTDKGFDEEIYLSAACDHYRDMEGAVTELFCKDVPAGLLDLDTKRGADNGIGWISLLYLFPEYRGRGCAFQLLSRAEQLYKKLGRNALRLTVYDTNGPAVRFYERTGFEKLSEESRPSGKLMLMEKRFDKEKQFFIKEN